MRCISIWPQGALSFSQLIVVAALVVAHLVVAVAAVVAPVLL